MSLYGIKKCHSLIQVGRQLERLLLVDGQFISRPQNLAGVVNEPFAAGVGRSDARRPDAPVKTFSTISSRRPRSAGCLRPALRPRNPSPWLQQFEQQHGDGNAPEVTDVRSDLSNSVWVMYACNSDQRLNNRPRKSQT